MSSPVVKAGRGKLILAAIVQVMALIVILSIGSTAYHLVTDIDTWLKAIEGELVSFAILCVTILAAAVGVGRLVKWRGTRLYVIAAIAVVVATAIADLYVFYASFDESWPQSTRYLFGFTSEIFRMSFLGVVITFAWLYLRTEAEHVAAVEQLAIDTERMDRETAEARLQMLEAQIEPHFLFNTLAHVKRLYETDRDAGERMMRNLKDYLSIALPQMREGAATLGREVDHVVAYLGIQQIRMGRRLAYAIDVPTEMRGARLPSLMVLTLVENAVKHGLSPLPEGGRIDVRATSAGGRLRIDVVDTGAGFAKSEGGGTGLANIRARLASTYGPAARFALALNRPTGVIGTIEIPLELPDPVIAPS